MKKTRKTKTNLLTQAFSFQPGLAVGVLGLALVGGGVMLTAGATTSTTLSACKPVSVSNVDAANPQDNQVAYSINNQGQGKTITATLKAGDDCVGPMVSLVSYNTTAADGMPRNKQTLHDSQTKALAATPITLTANVPDCYYQLDLAYGQPLDLTKGVDYDGRTNLLWAVLGGNKACAAATPTPSPTATATPTPTATPVTGNTTPTPTNTPNVSVAATPTPAPSVVPLLPGESAPPITTTSTLRFLPETGKPGSLLTFLGALLITAGLLHIYLSQRSKLIKGPKR